MSATSPQIERQVLSEAFVEAVDGWRLRSAVFLTFRFDPGFFAQEILPIFFEIPMSHIPQARLLSLEQCLRETGPIAVYYDPRGLQPGSAPAQIAFQRIPLIHRTGYFHPKNAFLLVERATEDPEENGEDRPTRLIAASMSANLTEAGWWKNVEVAHIEIAEPQYLCGFRDDLLSMLSVVRGLSPGVSDHAALDEIQAFVRKLQQDPQRLWRGLLLPRLFAGNGDLPDFLESVAGNRLRNRCLEVISPYFDDKESAKPIRELMERFRPRETRVFLPKKPEGEADCTESYWDSVKAAGALWGRLPQDLLRLSRDANRPVHAKVYRFFDATDRRETFFVGSVNLTNAGFGRGGNYESGFLVEQESKRGGEWWLEVNERRPAAFAAETESEDVLVGPGVKLWLQFNWTENRANALWNAGDVSPPLTLLGAGVWLGTVGPLEPQQLTKLDSSLAGRLKEHLASSFFVTVAIEDAPDATILVDEQGTTDKPSLLATFSADEILRFWSLLTDAQKQEFFESHAGELYDDDQQPPVPEKSSGKPDDGMFGALAHLYLSFGNWERAVRRALAEGRYNEAVDRLVGRKLDSLRTLVERISENKEADHVHAYVTLLCAIQLLTVLQKDEPDFYERERSRFELINGVWAAAQQAKARFRFVSEEEGARFFKWFERWFLRRATPAVQEPAG